MPDVPGTLRRMYEGLALLHTAFGLPEAEARKLSWKQWNVRLQAAAETRAAELRAMWGGPG